MWAEDVRRFLLNVMLAIETVDYASREVSLSVSSAWHDLEGDSLQLHAGEPVMQIPTVYTVNSSSTGNGTALIVEECEISTSVGLPLIKLQTGFEEMPLTCTSEALQNSLPLRDFGLPARLGTDCSNLVQGTFRACLRKDDADRVCTWGLSPDYTGWYYVPNETFPDEPGTANGCKRWCGVLGSSSTQWTNLGAFIGSLGVPLSCDSDGDQVLDGYELTGEFEAVLVSTR
jgi:hypothetical protein